MDDELWNILMALENGTRREMLKTLANYDSYALELSKMIGVSQQAINKQLDILEKLGFISTSGSIPSTIGPPRKVYRSMGFSTITIDYSRNFMEIKKREISYPDHDTEGNTLSLIDRLKSVNDEIESLDRKRSEAVGRKDLIIEKLRERASEYDGFYRKVIYEYLEKLDFSEVAEETGLPEDMVERIIGKFISS
ncbi:ArsR family transcriptional regulator [Ferroplasma sp.]|uniref:ArsR/SmtB family transcription factor n=1 Tax=Ferroplasma sp. TaxID=2591003 RepID=UPI002638EFDC|nr:ArsR family transcriptional regulator [Ferroplasma sp.]